MHVYAPEVQGGYVPIDGQMAGTSSWIVYATEYPAAHTMRLAAGETLPVRATSG
jgi:hypothetical protein